MAVFSKEWEIKIDQEVKAKEDTVNNRLFKVVTINNINKNSQECNCNINQRIRVVYNQEINNKTEVELYKYPETTILTELGSQ